MADHNHGPGVVKLQGECPRCDAEHRAELPADVQPGCCGSARLDERGCPVDEGGHAH